MIACAGALEQLKSMLQLRTRSMLPKRAQIYGHPKQLGRSQRPVHKLPRSRVRQQRAGKPIGLSLDITVDSPATEALSGNVHGAFEYLPDLCRRKYLHIGFGED